MVTQNHFVIPATVLEKFRSRGFPEGVTLTSDHCSVTDALGDDLGDDLGHDLGGQITY